MRPVLLLLLVYVCVCVLDIGLLTYFCCFAKWGIVFASVHKCTDYTMCSDCLNGSIFMKLNIEVQNFLNTANNFIDFVWT
jgi:hypothetical protein